MALAGLLAAGPASAALPGFAQVKAAHQPSDTLVLDRHGALLQRVRTDPTVRRGPWLALADVSPALRQAMLLSEDKRFYAHSGIDWSAVSAAAWGNLWHTRTRGASTITMQLAALIDDLPGEGDDAPARAGRRNLAQKLGQALDATRLEAAWRKDQILEAYLNLVPFRGELVGLDALSRTLFDKAAQGLDARESAVAAALVRGPNASPAQVASRACGVLRLMRPAQGRAAVCAGLNGFTTQALARRAYPASEGIAAHVSRQLLNQASAAHPGSALRSSLDAGLQRQAQDALQRALRELTGRHVADGAVLVLDNSSGQVLAWVGSSGPLSAAPEVDMVLAQRQAGSTLKPFLYAQAIAERRLTAASLLADSPAQIATAGGLYIPQNYDRRFKGWVSVRTALAASLNVPAVRTLVMVSPDALHQSLRRAGLPLRESGGYFGYSLALGSPEVSLLALTNAYRTLANGGRYGPTTIKLPGVAGPSQPVGAGAEAGASASAGPAVPAIDPRAAFIVADILADPLARARTFGSDSVLATRFWSAVKTGTSKDMRDNWAVGFSQRYTVGVWVGNADGAPMWDVSGSSGAAPVWAAVMAALHRSQSSRAPEPPPGLRQVAVQFDGGVEATRQEWFIAGTEQTRVALRDERDDAAVVGLTGDSSDGAAMDTPSAARAAAQRPARITAPTDGSIIALDPDIPPRNQRLQLRADGLGLRWQLDGAPLAGGPQAEWLPWPGRHRLQLVNGRGQVLDEVRIQVRGAGVKPGVRPGTNSGAGADAVRRMRPGA